MPKTSFYSGTGITSEKADAVESSANAAAQSAANAATSEANASTSETNAASSAANALTSETNAATSEANALASTTTAQNLEITSASFDTTDGTLTLTKANSGTVTTDLDGRYLTSETSHADVLVDGDFTTVGIMATDGSGLYSIVTDNSGDWNTAHGWGNHASAGYLTAHQDISGKADLSGADFTGDVTTTGTLATGGYTLASTDGTNGQALVTDGSGNVSFGDVTVDVSGKANLSGATFTGDVNIGTLPNDPESLSVTGVTALYGGANVTGNVTVTGTVDGRDLSVDGIKLDTIEAGATGDQTGAEIKAAYEAEANTNAFTDADHTKLDGLKGTLTTNYWDGVSWAQGSNRALTTTLTQYGDTQFVKHYGNTYKTYVDLSLDLIYGSASGTNDAYGYLSVTAPSPANETTVNMGTCTTFGTGISYIAGFSVSGDWTEYLSRYAGLSKNSDGSNAMGAPYKWVYNPYANTTTIWVSTYGNPPSSGDTIYLHPFDWESSGTVINGEQLMLDNSSGSGVNARRDFKIYLGRFDSRVSYAFRAKENSSTDVVTLDTLRMSTTEYEA